MKNLNGHNVIADAGYGSEQNYEYIEKEKITGYVKYNYFHMEQKKRFRDNIFLAQNLFYNPDKDIIICPMGQHMDFMYRKKNKSDLGYESEVSVYKACNCQGCTQRNKCHKAQGNRTIELNHKLLEYKRKARELLMGGEGMKHSSKAR